MNAILSRSIAFRAATKHSPEAGCLDRVNFVSFWDFL